MYTKNQISSSYGFASLSVESMAAWLCWCSRRKPSEKVFSAETECCWSYWGAYGQGQVDRKESEVYVSGD